MTFLLSRRAPASCLVAALMMAGCQKPAETGQQPAAPDFEAILGSRWTAIFADPAKVRAAADELDYAVGAYVPVGNGYRMTGREQVLPGPKSPTRVATRFTASGPSAAGLDRIEFAFDVVRPDDIPDSRRERAALQIPRRAVQGFLGRFEVGPSDRIKVALQNFTSASDTRHSARIDVSATETRTGYRLLVLLRPSSS